jgi:hypothetical protein
MSIGVRKTTDNGSAGLWLTLLDFLRFHSSGVVTAADADDFIYVFFAQRFQNDQGFGLHGVSSSERLEMDMDSSIPPPQRDSRAQ